MGGRFDGKVAIVTGGGSGIGRAAVEQLAREGARVLLTDWSKTRGTATAEALSDLGLAVAYQHHDAGDEASWAAVEARIAHDYGILHVLVNNAYSGAAANLKTLTAQILNDAMRVNVGGAALGLRMAAALMRHGGTVVNMSSAAAFVANPTNLAYAAAKLAVVQLTRSTAAELARRRPPIRVNAVAPGFTDTPALQAAVKALMTSEKGETFDDALAALTAEVPLGRVARAAEIANVIAFLASDESSYMTGQCLAVDGGSTLGRGS